KVLCGKGRQTPIRERVCRRAAHSPTRRYSVRMLSEKAYALGHRVEYRLRMMVSSLSMIFSNSACGWAPLRKTPLIKKPGVPATPTLLPVFNLDERKSC